MMSYSSEIFAKTEPTFLEELAFRRTGKKYMICLWIQRPHCLHVPCRKNYSTLVVFAKTEKDHQKNVLNSILTFITSCLLFNQSHWRSSWGFI